VDFQLGKVPDQGAVVWHCLSADSAQSGTKGTLMSKYAPSECRS
jgi:hypothetical protein